MKFYRNNQRLFSVRWRWTVSINITTESSVEWQIIQSGKLAGRSLFPMLLRICWIYSLEAITWCSRMIFCGCDRGPEFEFCFGHGCVSAFFLCELPRKFHNFWRKYANFLWNQICKLKAFYLDLNLKLSWPHLEQLFGDQHLCKISWLMCIGVMELLCFSK